MQKYSNKCKGVSGIVTSLDNVIVLFLSCNDFFPVMKQIIFKGSLKGFTDFTEAKHFGSETKARMRESSPEHAGPSRRMRYTK